MDEVAIYFLQHFGTFILIDQTAIIGCSQEIKALRALVAMVGPSDATVLILGESGTGKELVARALHGCSNRAKGSFVPVNCGAIPRELLESELFGHCKGSFSGAISDHVGRFELADGGTLFLDEIGDMPIDLQVKLLRVLQERCIDPVGSVRSRSINVRIIAATHKNIELSVQQHEFREDLYYRINVMPVEIKPLHDHREDIAVLFEYFAKLHAANNSPPICLDAPSQQLIYQYGWPGNVRELSNLVDRYTALYPGQEIDLRLVPPSMVPSGIRAVTKMADTEPLRREVNDFAKSHEMGSAGSSVVDSQCSAADPSLHDVQRVIELARGGNLFPAQGLPLKQYLSKIESMLIKQALGSAEGNVSKTARLLNLRRTTLIEKMNKYGLSNTK